MSICSDSAFTRSQTLPVIPNGQQTFDEHPKIYHGGSGPIWCWTCGVLMQRNTASCYAEWVCPDPMKRGES